MPVVPAGDEGDSPVVAANPGRWPAAADIAALAPAFGLPSKDLQAILSEMAAFKQSSQQLREAPIYAETPLVIIMHGLRIMPDGVVGDAMEQDWMRLQRELASHYRNGTVITAPQSAHAIPLDQPDLVVETIRRLLPADTGSSQMRLGQPVGLQPLGLCQSRMRRAWESRGTAPNDVRVVLSLVTLGR